MRKPNRPFAIPALLVFSAACGGAATPAASPAAVAVTPAPGGGAGAATPSPVGGGVATREPAEVPATGDVVATFRLKDVRSLLANLAAQAGVPGDTLDAGLQKFGGVIARDLLREEVDEAAFAATIDWSAPIDGAIVVDASDKSPEAHSGFSFGLTSLPRALAAFKKKPTRAKDGGYQPTLEEGLGLPKCAVYEAAGRAPARLVCGDRSADLSAVGAYLATSLAKRDMGPSEYHGEVRLRPLLDRVGPELAMKAKGLPLLAATEKIGVPMFDEALMEAASALGDEVGGLVHDLDSADVDATWKPGSGLQVNAKLNFAGRKSWLVSRLVDAPPGGPRVPDVLLNAPASASTASYSTGIDTRAYAPVLRVVRALVEGKLTHAGFATPADRKALAGLLRPTTGDFVGGMSASGSFEGGALPTSLQSFVGAFLGYSVTGIEGDSAATVAWLKDVVAAYNRPTIQAWMKGELKDDAKFLPTLKIVRAPAVLGPRALEVEVKVSNLEDPLAAFGLAVKLSEPQKDAKPTLTSASLHLLLVPEGKRFYVGFAADRDKLAALLAKIKVTPPGSDSIAAVPELEAFRRTPHRSGAYATLKGGLSVLEAFRPLLALLPLEASGSASRLLVALGQLPNGGKTPIAFTTDVTNADRPSLLFSFEVPRGTLEDLAFLGKVIAEEAKKHAPPPIEPALPTPQQP